MEKRRGSLDLPRDLFPSCPDAFPQLVRLFQPIGQSKTCGTLKTLNKNLKGALDSLYGTAFRNSLAVNPKS